MPLWKYLVLIGGIAGITGFFLPLINFEGKLSGSISAYQVIKGIDDVANFIDGAKPIIATDADAHKFTTRVNKDLAEYRNLVIALYAPAALLALFGAFAGVRRKLGRIGGLFVILLGAANALIWFLLFQVSVEAQDSSASLGIGLHMLAIAGAFALTGGIGALVLPDHGDEY